MGLASTSKKPWPWRSIAAVQPEIYQDRVLNKLHIQLGLLGDTYLSLKMRGDARASVRSATEGCCKVA